MTHQLALDLPAATLLADDGESGSANWTAQGGWTLSTDQAHSPSTAWASDAGGGATPGSVVTLTLNSAVSLSGTKMARLTLWHSYTLSSGAYAYVALSSDGGQEWWAADYRAGSSAWTPLEVDLTPLLLAGESQVSLRLLLAANEPGDRWLVDDVRFEALLPPEQFSAPFMDDVEDWRRWDATGNWEPVTHTVHSGLWAWQGAGDGATLALHRPLALTGTVAPRLSFWYTGSLTATAAGRVEVSTTGGQGWTPVYTLTSASGGWAQATASLEAYAGQLIALRFRLEGSEANWSIDDVSVYDAPLTYTLPLSDDMEVAGRWWAGGDWETVTTTAHSAATSWRGYGDDAALILMNRLDLGDALTPTLSLWQRFDLPTGYEGYVKVTTDGGLNWQRLYTQTATLNDWTATTVDLSAYAGEQIGLDFYLSGPLTATVAPGQGWFIDDVLVEQE